MRLSPGVVLLLALGCAQDHDHNHGSPSDACADGGAYERVGVTDEACRSFVEADSRGLVVTDASRAPAWTSPAVDAVGAAPPRFAWTKGTLARATWKRVLRFFDPLPEALAHGDTTGDAFLLLFRDGAGRELHRVMTTSLEYVPSTAAWDRVAAGKTVAVTLIGVRFTQNAIASGTRPTAAPARTLTRE